MFRRYKEFILGIGFGMVAMLIDTATDARVEGNSVGGELAAHPGMMVYRLGFVLLGLALGWLLWRSRKSEREVELLEDKLAKLRQQVDAKSLLLRSKLQLLLTRDDLHLSAEAQRLIRDAYERSQELQRVADER
jgi:hypothetical protein